MEVGRGIVEVGDVSPIAWFGIAVRKEARAIMTIVEVIVDEASRGANIVGAADIRVVAIVVSRIDSS